MTTNTQVEELREKLMQLKPHSDNQLNLGQLLSYKEIDSIMDLFANQLELARLDGRRIQAEATLDKWDNTDETAEYKFGRFLEAQVAYHKYELSELTKQKEELQK